MSITKEKKLDLIDKFKKSQNDTGSADIQVAILSEKIKSLTGHLKEHHKDFISRRGLLTMVGKRRNLLNYIKNNDENLYRFNKTLGLEDKIKFFYNFFLINF